MTNVHILLALSASTALLFVWALRLRSQRNGSEARYQAFLERSESGVEIRSKIEAQLLEKQGRLDHLAHHDQLTGLPNRLFLAAHLPQAIDDARRNGSLLAVLFLDLDRFKHINDSRGHETGDKLLQTVAERIRAATV